MLLPALALHSTAHASDPVFLPELQYRPRLELDTGRDFDADAGNVWFVSHRARLGATLSWGPFSSRIVFQDVRAWGEELDTRRDFSGDGIDLAFGTVSWQPTEGVSLTVGREEVSLQDERLIARANWRQPGRHFDGARFSLARGGWAAEAAGYLVIDGDTFAFATQDQVEPGTGDQVLAFARGGRHTDTFVAEGVVVLDSRRNVPDAEVLRVTPGVFVKGTAGSVSLRGEAYGQLGSAAGGDQQIRAFMLGVEGAIAPDVGVRPVLGAAYEVLSGDGDPGDGIATAFDTIRGANHRYYGHIDIATFVRGARIGDQGLHDVQLDLRISPHDKVTLGLDQHLFAPAALAPGAEGWVALESDVHLRVQAHEGVTVSAGFSNWTELADTPRPTELFGFLMVDVAFRQKLTLPAGPPPIDAATAPPDPPAQPAPSPSR